MYALRASDEGDSSVGGGVSREFCDFSLAFFKRCHLYYVVLHMMKI
jgi:hypothetical protein